MKKDKARVLFVDDEPSLLRSMSLILRRHFEVETAESGKEGLECMKAGEPFAVVVSDMRMPEMNGAKFLSAARELAPNSTRILLTGETDLSSAVEAVNEGAIFRFLKKPCENREMLEVLNAAAEQHRLLHAEQDLLQNTLRGAVALLTDILGHIHPQAFSRSSRIHRTVRHICGQLNLQDAWSFEIAGLLAHIGLVTVPAETVEKDCAGTELLDWEREMIDNHPAGGAEMLSSIPRLETVAKMIARQADKPDAPLVGSPETWEAEILGGELLRTAMAFEREWVKSGSASECIEQLTKEGLDLPDPLLALLSDYELGLEGMASASLQIDQLAAGMVIEQEVRAKSGGLLAAKGQLIDAMFINRLRNFDRGSGVEQPILVLSPISLLSKKRSA